MQVTPSKKGVPRTLKECRGLGGYSQIRSCLVGTSQLPRLSSSQKQGGKKISHSIAAPKADGRRTEAHLDSIGIMCTWSPSRMLTEGLVTGTIVVCIMYIHDIYF